MTLSLLAVCGWLLAFAPAKAEILQISATGFVRHCPCDLDPADDSEVDRGVLVPQGSARYFASVVFPRSGQRICGFSLIYRDVNANETMTASLLRKSFTIGGNAFNAPTVIARVRSAAGAVETVRRATTTSIGSPVIDTADGFYFVQINVPNINLNVLGIQIDVRPTCD